MFFCGNMHIYVRYIYTRYTIITSGTCKRLIKSKLKKGVLYRFIRFCFILEITAIKEINKFSFLYLFIYIYSCYRLFYYPHYYFIIRFIIIYVIYLMKFKIVVSCNASIISNIDCSDCI